MANCGGCGLRVIWLRNIRTNRMQPINAAPSSGGNIMIHTDTKTGAPVGFSVLTASQKEARSGQQQELYTSHFSTCPEAGHFKRRDPKGRQSRQ